MSHRFIIGLGVVNLIGLLVLFVLHFTSTRDVRYVDSSKLINEYQGMIDARKAYQSKASVWQANIDTLADEVQAKIAEYENNGNKMPARERLLLQELIRSKQSQLAQYQKSIQERAAQEDAQATQKVMDEINAKIRQYGEAHGCKIIFAATEYGNIAFAENGLDLTEEILEQLNKSYTGQVVR